MSEVTGMHAFSVVNVSEADSSSEIGEPIRDDSSAGLPRRTRKVHRGMGADGRRRGKRAKRRRCPNLGIGCSLAASYSDDCRSTDGRSDAAASRQEFEQQAVGTSREVTSATADDPDGTGQELSVSRGQVCRADDARIAQGPIRPGAAPLLLGRVGGTIRVWDVRGSCVEAQRILDQGAWAMLRAASDPQAPSWLLDAVRFRVAEKAVWSLPGEEGQPMEHLIEPLERRVGFGCVAPLAGHVRSACVPCDECKEEQDACACTWASSCQRMRTGALGRRDHVRPDGRGGRGAATDPRCAPGLLFERTVVDPGARLKWEAPALDHTTTQDLPDGEASTELPSCCITAGIGGESEAGASRPGCPMGSHVWAVCGSCGFYLGHCIYQSMGCRGQTHWRTCTCDIEVERTEGSVPTTSRASPDPIYAARIIQRAARESRNRHLRLGAVVRLQRAVRGWWQGSTPQTQLEREWTGKVLQRHGPLVAHVRFLQDLFRESRRRYPRAWSRGGRAGTCRIFARPETLHRCQGGKSLAGDLEFRRQQQLSEEWMHWYSAYPLILRRLRARQGRGVLHAFCGGGGSSEGERRAGGGGSHGVDFEPQPDYERRFGAESFTQSDALDWSKMAKLRDRHGLIACYASPPCKYYSSARRKDQPATQPPLIPQTRMMLRTLFDYWVLENVLGARKHMSSSATELDGALFGLRVARSRLFETSFEVVVDQAVAVPADVLRCRTCLGHRRRWRRVDRWGRPEPECCAGNIYAVQGREPYKCTAAECARAMGVDEGHMSYDRLAQALPPAYVQLLYSQMCMRILQAEYGMSPITFDEYLRDPANARKHVGLWMRGAGDPSPAAGMAFGCSPSAETEPSKDDNAQTVGLLDGIGGTENEAGFRELYYSEVGGFDSRWASDSDVHDLDRLRPHERVMPSGWDVARLTGKNTLIEMSTSQVKVWAARIAEHVRASAPGTRVTLRFSKSGLRGMLGRLGFSEWQPEGGTTPDGHCMVMGRRGPGSDESYLCHDWAESFMDPRDLGIGVEPMKSQKRQAAWQEMVLEPECWKGKGLSPWAEKIMTEGAPVHMQATVGGYEIPQYPFASSEARQEAAWETDRAIAAGHMEHVPESEADDILLNYCVHPWTMDLKGGKWRACQDYSIGTNRGAASAPFGLPTPFDVRRALTPDTHFAKYDLRDGFWRVPTSPELRRRLVMRHPATAKLLWCKSLPFGYIDSPRLFCAVTEAVAQEFRKRVGDRLPHGTRGGIHIWCYVDDYLIAGDNEELTRIGCSIFEELMHELGFEWAPSKQRGPSRVMEFLGMLIVNTPEKRCIALTRKRQENLRELISSWMTRRRAKTVMAEPRELAQLLGQLVFASQVIPGGRVAMQAMLAQFKGLEVDWRQGLVSLVGQARWTLVPLDQGFWRDLEWWDMHFERRNCVSLFDEERASAAVTGTDASDWGSGQAAFLDGSVEEARLEFTSAEKRRPINWRELSGIVRILEWFGPRMQGRTILIETDNMAAKGAASKMASTSRDMSELVRRLLELAARHRVRIRVIHTPGEKLHRPDQSSRGDPIEEPRARLSERFFDLLSRRVGGFTEFIGPERAHQRWTDASGGTHPRLWMHPTYNTVGTALRLACSRMADDPTVRGIVVVPDAQEAGWQTMLKHFSVIGRLPAGGAHLQTCTAGQWRTVHSHRPSLVLSFPRAAGNVTQPVITRGSTWEVKALPLLPGDLVYSPGVRAGMPGCIYAVLEPFDGSELDDGEPVVKLAELVRGKGKHATVHTLHLTQVKDKYGDRPQSLAPGRWQPWVVNASMLWTVAHMVKARPGQRDSKSAPAGSGVSKRTPAMLRELWEKSFEFDFKRAEVEIAREKVMLSRQGNGVLRPPEAQNAQSTPPLDVSDTPTNRNSAALSTSGFGAESAKGGQGQVVGAPMTRLRAKATASNPGTVDTEPDKEKASTLSGGTMETTRQQDPRSVPATTTESMKELENLAKQQLVTGQLEFTQAAESAREAASIGEQSALRAKGAAKEKQKTTEKEVAETHAPASGTQVASVPQLGRPAAAMRKMICRSPAVMCAGCDMAIKVGEEMEAFSCGMVHLSPACKELAVTRALQTEGPASDSRSKREAERVRLQSAKKEAQMVHRFSDDRMDMVLRCLDGKCCETQETRVMCMGGCGRGLHALTCAQVSKARSKLGFLRCIDCRVGEMMSSSRAEPGGELHKRVACRSLLLELTCGAETTARNLTEFEKLSREWVVAMADGCTDVAMDIIEPAHGEESFMAFLNWLVTDAGRARSFITLVRSFAIVLSKMEAVVWTSRPRVKAVIKEITESLGLEPEPCVLLSRMIIRIGIEETIPSVCSMRYILMRTYALLTCELVGGLRVGEATGGGEGHGLLANHCCLAYPSDPGRFDLKEVVVFTLEDSKTKFGRRMAIAGKTRGSLAFEAALYVKGLWKESGFAIKEEMRDGMRILRPDYFVLRVSLLGMQKAMITRFAGMLEACKEPAVAVLGKYSARKVLERGLVNETDGEEKKYVNIAGGARESDALAGALQWVQSIGLGRFANVVPGPLLRATDGKKITHMPLQTGSAYAHLSKAMEKAYFTSRARGVVDQELDLGSHDPDKPKIGHHWARRKADQVARDSRDVTETSEETIDEAFGWNQKQAKRKQQLHYAGTTEILKLARVTLML